MACEAERPTDERRRTDLRRSSVGDDMVVFRWKRVGRALGARDVIPRVWRRRHDSVQRAPGSDPPRGASSSQIRTPHRPRVVPVADLAPTRVRWVPGGSELVTDPKPVSETGRGALCCRQFPQVTAQTPSKGPAASRALVLDWTLVPKPHGLKALKAAQGTTALVVPVCGTGQGLREIRHRLEKALPTADAPAMGDARRIPRQGSCAITGIHGAHLFPRCPTTMGTYPVSIPAGWLTISAGSSRTREPALGGGM